MARVAFAISCLEKRLRGQERSCPFCGNRETRFLQRKHFILELRRCPSCELLFRWPKDTPADNSAFYQEAYQEGSVTARLSEEEIERLRHSNFQGTPWELGYRLEPLRALVPGGKVLDYGSSWGYLTDQLNRAGYDAVGWEPSRPRVDYGRKMLDVPIESDWARVEDRGPFDGILCIHVLEHVPTPAEAFARFSRILAPGGWLVVYVPNGGGKNAREEGARWGPMIGEKHCLALHAPFFERNLVRFGFEPPRFASDPYAKPIKLVSWDGAEGRLEGDELLVVARRGPKEA